MRDTLFIRLLNQSDKGEALARRIAALREGRADEDVYAVNPESFRQVPNTPFCYWVSERIRRLFKELPPFEAEGRTVKQGLATADDFRFVRAWWEVPAERILNGMRYAGGGSHKDQEEKWTEERIREFQAWCRKRTYEGKRWAPFAKGGEYSPYYADIHLVVNWEKEGAEIRNNLNEKGAVRSNVWMLRDTATNYFFRPGLTFRNRPHRLGSFAVLPPGCLFSHVGQAVFIEKGITHLLAVLNTRMSTEFVMLSSGRGQEGSGQTIKFETGIVASLPIPEQASENKALPLLAIECYTRLLQIDNDSEISHAFGFPNLIKVDGTTLVERAVDYGKHYAETERELLRIQSEVEGIAYDLYGFTEGERKAVSGMQNAVGSENLDDGDECAGDENDANDADKLRVSSSSAYGPLLTAHFLSWFVGVAFGRWDVRIAIDPSLAPKLPDPFDPLPVCPPGMLVGPDGLPAEPGRIVSEEWLRARTDANTLPPDGSVKNPTIPDSEYPLRISWDGVLVDDPGGISGQWAVGSGQPHKDDIVRRVREVLEVLFPDRPAGSTAHCSLPTAHSIEQEACDILGVSDLREYFRRPAGFFQDHLKRYSKSRRKAPIYWPLSTASGSYTIWLYYHRLNDQTLYMVVNKYMEPKIAEVQKAVGSMQYALEARERGITDSLPTAHSSLPTGQLRQQLEEARAFLGELRDLREELLRIAALPYKPDLNDGVIINAAPLHKLFRLRSWAKDTEDCWKKLEKGDYDWAHLAYTIWPERVREVCRRDRSIAIAHGLEDLCEAQAPEPKKKGGRGRRKKEAAR